VRSALAWCLSPDGPAPPPERARLGLSLCATMHAYWLRWPHNLQESTPWYRRALEVGSPDDSSARARVMAALAIDEDWHGRTEHGRALTRSALEMATRLGDSRVAAGASTLLGAFTAGTGDHAAAIELLADAERLARSVDALEILSTTLLVRAECETASRRHDVALDLYRQCAALAAQRGDERELVNTSVALAAHLGAAGSPQDGLEELDRARPGVLRIGSQTVAASALEAYAGLFAVVGDADAAAVIMGSLWGLTERLGGVVDHSDEEELWMREVGIAAARDTLGDDRWRALTGHGRHMTLQEALHYAHGRISQRA
jgi:tetratricopeptide (TPR) repeat protein